MNAAKLSPGSRTWKLLKFLEAHPGGVTGADIYRELGILNPGTEISGLNQELRADCLENCGDVRQAAQVECRYERRTDTGRKVYRYRLVTLPLSTPAVGAAHLAHTPSAAPATLFDEAP